MIPFQGDCMKVNKICILGIMIGLSMIFSYLETMINIIPSVPGFKIGLANICVLFCLYKYSAKDAFIVLIFRVILVGNIFTSPAAMLYSLSGALLSLFIMIALKKLNMFSVYAISTAGGVCHNIGQLFMAVIILNTKAVFSYLPFLIIFGSVSGFLMGVISKEIINRITVTERIK